MRYASVPQVFVFSAMICICSFLFSHPVHGFAEKNQAAEQRLVFGIAPFMSPTSLVKRMAPLRKYLSESTGLEIAIETATTASVFTERTLEGRYDLVFTNPTFALMAMDKGGFKLIATQKKKLAGHFVVMEKSKIKKLKDLEGKLLGAPPKVGFLGQLVKPHLDKSGLDKNKLPEIKYFKSHKDVIAALRFGEIDASFIAGFMEKSLLKKGHPIRRIHRTGEYPGMTMLAKNEMKQELVNIITMSLFELDKNEKGKNVLKKISMPGFKKINMKQLEIVRPYLPAQK